MLDTEIKNLILQCAKDDECASKLLALVGDLQTKVEISRRDLKLLEAAIRNDYDSILITQLELDDPGPVIVYVNEGFTKMTGYTKEEVIGKTPRILQGPKTDRAVLDKLKYSLIKGRSFFGQTINYRKDGSEFVNQWDIHPLLDDNGKITHWVSYQHDITDRKRAELSVMNTNVDTDELYEESKRTIMDLDAEGTVVSANKSFRDLVGYKKEELRTMKIWDLMPEKFGQVIKTRYDHLWHKEFGNGQKYSLILNNHQGMPVQVEITTKHMDLNNGPIVRADVSNLSLRKKVMNTLRQRHTAYGSLFDRKVDFNYGLIQDAENRFRFKWISDGFQRVTGYTVDECLSSDGWDKVVHPDDKNKVAEHILKAFHGSSSAMNYRILTKDGVVKSVLDYAKPDKMESDGQVLSVVASTIDVTNRKESTV